MATKSKSSKKKEVFLPVRNKQFLLRIKPINHSYVRDLSKKNHISLSEFIDSLIEKHRLG